MKIVHLCLSAFFIDNYSYQENMLPKYHVKMGHEVTVIASLYTFDEKGQGCYLSEPTEYDDPNGFHVVRLAFKKPFAINRILCCFEGLSKILDRECPDVIFSHNVSYSDVSVVVSYIKKHPHVKVYADNHGDYINSAKNFASKYILHPIVWRFYAKMIQPYLVRCYGVTPMRCRFLKEMYHIDASKIEFLPMGVDDDAIPSNYAEVKYEIRKELSIPQEDIVIFTGGKISLLKNTHILIDALSQIGNEHLHLIICGTLTPEMEYLKDVISKNKCIHHLGWCNSERVMNCMIASDMACFPGTHSTLWEQAVGVGLPSIFKRWNEMEHVNVNGNCIFVSGDNIEELKTEILIMTCPENIIKYKTRAAISAKSFLYSEIAKKAIY